jgi:hypothetical protein
VPPELLQKVFQLLQDSEAAVDHPPAGFAAAAATPSLSGLLLLGKDARLLRPPGTAKEHIGFHPSILRCVVGTTSRLFEEWLGDLVADLADIGLNEREPPELRGNKHVLVVMYDGEGTRRAPACAHLLSHVISHGQSRNIVLGRVRHLSCPYWGDTACGGCAACWANTPTRQQTFGRALRAWEGAWLNLSL